MAGFLTGVVSIVDHEGNRVDTPNVEGDHAPVELQLGSTMAATKTTNGSLTRVTINATAGGGGEGGIVLALDTHDDFRVLDITDVPDGTVVHFKTPVGVFVYEDSLGAGQADDDRTILKLGAVSPGANGRAYSVNAPSLPTIASLRLAVSGKNDAVQVQAFATAGDGGGGTFNKRTGSAVDNGGTIIVPSGVSTFYYERQFSGAIDACWFGLKAGSASAASNSTKLQALFNYVASLSNARTTEIGFPWPADDSAPGIYFFDTPLTLQGGISQSITLRGVAAAGSSNTGVQLFYSGAATSGAFIHVVGGQGLRIERLRIHAGFNYGGAQYALWLDTDQPHSVGLSDVVCSDCIFTGCRNTTDAALVAAGPASGSPNQADTIRFENCLFLSSFSGTALHDGFRPLIGGNTKFFTFTGCQFGYNRYAIDGTLLNGPLLMSGCTFAGSRIATALLGQNTFLTMVSCYGEQENAIVDTPGAGAANGCVALYNCEFHVQGWVANAQGQFNTAIQYYGGSVLIDGGIYQCQQEPVITTASNATPIVVTTSGNHRLVNNDRVQIYNVSGNAAANGYFRVTKLTDTTFSLKDLETGDDVAGSGAGTGGLVQPALKIAVLDTVAFPAANAIVSVRNSAWGAVGKYLSVRTSSGNYSFDSAYAATLTGTVPQAVAYGNTGVSAATGSSLRLPDIGHVAQIASVGTLLPRRAVANFIGATATDNPTTQSTDITILKRSDQTISGNTSFGWPGSSPDVLLSGAIVVMAITSEDNYNVTFKNAGAPIGAIIHVRAYTTSESTLTFFDEGDGSIGSLALASSAGDVNDETSQVSFFNSNAGWRVLLRGDLALTP